MKRDNILYEGGPFVSREDETYTVIEVHADGSLTLEVTTSPISTRVGIEFIVSKDNVDRFFEHSQPGECWR